MIDILIIYSYLTLYIQNTITKPLKFPVYHILTVHLSEDIFHNHMWLVAATLNSRVLGNQLGKDM